MADTTNLICGNCGKQTVLWCYNEFTDELCTSCGHKNLSVALSRVETQIPCKNGARHDYRIAKGGKIFCPKCYTELGTLAKEVVIQ